MFGGANYKLRATLFEAETSLSKKGSVRNVRQKLRLTCQKHRRDRLVIVGVIVTVTVIKNRDTNRKKWARIRSRSPIRSRKSRTKALPKSGTSRKKCMPIFREKLVTFCKASEIHDFEFGTKNALLPLRLPALTAGVHCRGGNIFSTESRSHDES